jgi:tyrosinase
MASGRFDDMLGAPRTRRAAMGGLATGGLALAAAGITRTRQTAFAEEATPAAMAGHSAVSPFAPGPGEPIRVRKSVAALTPEERTDYVNAVLALKKKPSPWAAGMSVYDTFVMWHRDAFGCAVMAAHMGPAFLPWHRAFLRLFEDQLREIEPTVTVPYWDWTVDQGEGAPVWTDDFMGGNGDPSAEMAVTIGPFRKDAWELVVFDYSDTARTPFLVRDLGGGFMAPTLPTAEQVEEALSIAAYDAAPWTAMVPARTSFRNFLEGWRDCVQEECDPTNGMSPTCVGSHDLHNRVHLWVSGEFRLAHEAIPENDPAATPGPATVEPGTNPATDLMGTMAFNSSPNDPVFWLHHANVDRIYQLWLDRHGEVYLPETGGPHGHNIDDAMWPYTHIGLTATPRMCLSTEGMGFRYE